MMMNQLFKRICSPLLAAILAISTLFAGLPETTVFAAPETYAAAQISANAERVNDAAVKEALDAIKSARKTGSREDYIKTRNLIALLRPIDRLRLYADLIKDYYLRNYRTTGFRYFNAERYLAENEDVRQDALRLSPDDIYLYALNHYLERGIIEGRSSGTSFDPMVAILTRPEILFDIIEAPDDSISDILYESFVQKTGKTTTDSYSVLRGNLTVIEKGETNGTVFRYSDTSEAEHSDSSGSSEDHDSGDDSDDESGNGTDYRERRFINNLAKDITPYTLYRKSFDDESFSFVTYNPFKDVNNNKNVQVRFLGDNYRRARELSENKRYTLMMYLCGTNLERDKDYRRVTAEIVSMLQADMSNVNVILCVGGTETYGNDYLNDPEHGASGMRAGIYYLNPDGFSKEVKDKIAKVSTESGEAMMQLSDDEESTKTDLSLGLHFKDIITSDTLIQLVSTSAVDMADPSFLAGFINLSTNLFPADDYGLTLSNHGGGLEGGVIFTDNTSDIQSNGITVYELESALASTDLYKDKDVSPDGKLGVIFYSACTMGSTELAYSTKDYYRYMVASEEMTAGHDPYRDIINGLNYDVGTGASDCTIAKGITYKYEIGNPAHHGFADYFVGSIATYSSDDMDNMYEKINDLSAELSEILGTDKYSDTMKNDVFMAFRKAALSCYPTSGARVSQTYYQHLSATSYVDIGELLTHLKNNLDDVFQNGYNGYGSSEKSEFNRLREKLDNTLNTGFLVYLSIYNKEMGGITAMGMSDEVIPLNYTINTSGNIWTDIRSVDGRRDYLYGSSIYLPLLADINNFNDENSEYYKYFKESDLNDYVDFITDYLTYLNGEYKERINALKGELFISSSPLYKLVSQVRDQNNNVVRTLTDDNGNSREYISFKIADSYGDVEPPQHSLGNPMLDILEVQPSMTVAAVHKQRLAAEKEGQKGYLEVSMICAEQPVPSFSFALDSNTISFDVTDTTRSIIRGMTMEGTLFGSTDTDWQFVLRSDRDEFDGEKAAILQAVFPGVQDVANLKAITVSGKYIYKLSEDASDSYAGEGYHVFKVSDDDEYKYVYSGSVSSEDNGDSYTYSKADGVIGVSAYHYVLREILLDDGTKCYEKVQLEGSDLGSVVKDGFFSTQGLVLKTEIDVTQGEQVNDDWIYSGKATAYCIDPFGKNMYSCVGYVSQEGERDYHTGSITVGNGPLETIDDIDDDKIEGIGAFGTEEPDGDTDKSDESREKKDPTHAVLDNNAPVEAPIENNVSEDIIEPAPVEESADDEAPIEDNASEDILEPALAEPHREDAEEEEVPSDSEVNDNDCVTNSGDEDESSGDDDESSSDSSDSDSNDSSDSDSNDSSDSGECEE